MLQKHYEEEEEKPVPDPRFPVPNQKGLDGKPWGGRILPALDRLRKGDRGDGFTAL